ncbi:hypothetical protein L228DRAFT_244135 [Xylona heveae TC161]|uniref:Uncharacterized protein n=1 Tax=Xylona heveae (strain CBS 132557 / TC161) TaxID=1328760 RepID=A0A165ISK2_XYLHT|nr:hypothetical protein L228DRAFT_244135 [Xylona heveae TC161]KZF25324.1 hypothetical protein L228DRAFT_244135 [Xylona heveae TC161]
MPCNRVPYQRSSDSQQTPPYTHFTHTAALFIFSFNLTRTIPRRTSQIEDHSNCNMITSYAHSK